FHRSRADVAAATLGRPVHHDRVVALGFAHKGDILDPLDANFHETWSPAQSLRVNSRRTWYQPMPSASWQNVRVCAIAVALGRRLIAFRGPRVEKPVGASTTSNPAPRNSPRAGATCHAVDTTGARWMHF